MILPPSLIVEHIFPFLDRETYDHAMVLNREIHQLSRQVCLPPWPSTCTMDVEQEISCVQFAPSNGAIACGCENGDVLLWRRCSNGIRVTLLGHRLSILVVQFAPDESFLASGSVDCTIRLWRLNNNNNNNSRSSDHDLSSSAWSQPTCEATILMGHARPIHSICILPDSQTIISGAHESTIRMWNTKTGTCAGTILTSNPDNQNDKVESIAISPDGQHLATATWDGSIRLFERSDTAYRDVMDNTFESGLPLTTIQFSEDGTYLYGLKGFRVRRWEVATGHLTYWLGKGVHKVYSLAVSHRAQTVAYGDQYGTIRVSKLGDKMTTDQSLKTLYGHHHQCHLAFAPNGTTLVSGSGDGALRLWSI